MTTLIEKIRTTEKLAKQEAKRKEVEHQEYLKKLEASRPERVKKQVDEVWPDIEATILQAVRENKRTVMFYRGPHGYWTYDSSNPPTADTVAIFEEIQRRASGVTVGMDTYEVPGCDPNSGGLDGPQGPTWTTYSHYLRFWW